MVQLWFEQSIIYCNHDIKWESNGNGESIVVRSYTTHVDLNLKSYLLWRVKLYIKDRIYWMQGIKWSYLQSYFLFLIRDIEVWVKLNWIHQIYIFNFFQIVLWFSYCTISLIIYYSILAQNLFYIKYLPHWMKPNLFISILWLGFDMWTKQYKLIEKSYNHTRSVMKL